MSWKQFHSLSEDLAAAAETAMRKGDISAARDLYRQAADAESEAFETLSENQDRTLGITAVSAVALRYKAHEFDSAEQSAHRYLALPTLPNFARIQLRELLERIWAPGDNDRDGVTLTADEVRGLLSGAGCQ